jgi:hypothetical protein
LAELLSGKISAKGGSGAGIGSGSGYSLDSYSVSSVSTYCHHQ